MSPISAFTVRHPGCALLGVAAPSASRPAHSLLAPATHATPDGCRSDPVVTLSNGITLDLSTVANDTYDDVQQVGYTLHLPVGTSVTSEVYTSVLGPHDTFQFHADEPPSTCRADAKVTTPPQIPVAAATDLVSVNGTVVSTASAAGQSPYMLWTNFSG
jgi:hypothetical protein